MKKHLKQLEEEAVSFIRDTYADSENPLVLYSIGKDSSVLLHLFRKAFFPANIPIPFMHIDTGWKFKEMIQFRDQVFKKYNLKGIVKKNAEGLKNNINPFDHGNYTDVMKTETLKNALKEKNYDFVYGGARRTKNQVVLRRRFYLLEIKIKHGIQNHKGLSLGICLIH